MEVKLDNSIKDDKYFVNPDNLRLFEQIWRPDIGTKNRALVFIIHGLNEHSSFFYEETIVNPLIKIGCIVVTHDHVGHGRSDGNRKVVGNVDNLARDVLLHIEDIRRRLFIEEHIPTFLYGHSLGGLIACMISLKNPDLISGMVLESPALYVSGKAGSSWVSIAMARLIAMMMPAMVLRKPKFTNLSRNPSIVQMASEDEFRNRDGLTLGTAVNISKAIFKLKSKLKEIKTPFFVAHGEKDCIVSIVASQTLQNEAAVEDKFFHMYDNSFHLLRGDSGNVGEDFTSRIVEWIDKHINYQTNIYARFESID